MQLITEITIYPNVYKVNICLNQKNLCIQLTGRGACYVFDSI